MVNINKLRKMEKAKQKTEPAEADARKAVALTPEQENAAQKSKSVRTIQEPTPASAPITSEQSRSPQAVTKVSSAVVKESPQSSKVGETTEKPIAMAKMPSETDASDSADDRGAELKELITFRLDGRLFGIFVDNVHSVVKPSHITRVPQVEEYLVGIMNLRGIITPIYDLKCRFSIGRTLVADKTRILIIEYDDSLVGFLVDEIATLHNINRQAIQPAPEIAAGINQRYIQGVVALPEQEELIIVIALEEIIRSKERYRVGH